MIELKTAASPRKFELGGFQMVDHGSVRFFPERDRTNEILAMETSSGKKCEITATGWGYYLGPSLNSRLIKNGFRAALMMNENKQIYLVAVDSEKIAEFDKYLKLQSNSRVLCWMDEWRHETE